MIQLRTGKRDPSADDPSGSVRRVRVDLFVPMRTILLIAAAVAVVFAFVSIGSTFLIVFIGIFLALVFEFPVRYVIEKTGWSRGASATATVLGSAVLVTILALILLVPLVGGVRDVLHQLPQTVEDLRSSNELSWIDGDVGRQVQDGADEVASRTPDAVSAVIGIGKDIFTVGIALFTILFICLFLLTDMGKLKASVASVLMPSDEQRWMEVFERVTATVSRWAIGVIVIAAIAGFVQGLTAFLLGSSIWLGLGVIAGLLDLIPNIGATLAGFILVPAIWAEQGAGAALIMLIVVLVYQQAENNFLTPKIQGKAVDLSAFFIIVAVTLFGALLGVLGALTAVPLAATIQIVVQELTQARREQVAAVKQALEPLPPPDPNG